MEKGRVDKLLDRLRNQCLHKGVGGIKALSVVFRNMDTDFSKRLSYTELEEGIKMYGLQVDDDDLKLLFETFDKDKNRSIDFLELVTKLQPPMPKKRVEVINQAFDKLDAIKDGVLKMEDLKSK